MRKVTPAGLAALGICLAAVWFAGIYGPMAAFVHSVKTGTTAAPAAGPKIAAKPVPDLREWIETEAAKRYTPPSNAVIDRIWKAIPGYNGREVDVSATYEQARLSGLAPESEDFPWVYREVRPKIGLEDLPLQPIYRGNPAKPMVALMINVAWGDEFLPSILDTLDAEKVKATFFLDGSWLARHEETARSILARGHELSNHAYSHPDMSRLGLDAQRRQIARTEELLKRLGVRNRWFAPPSGAYDARTVQAAGDYGLRTVLWTLDTVDWRNPPASSVVDKISRNIGPGQLILMHPTATTRDALAGMIRSIRARGYRLGTVSETLSPDRAEPPAPERGGA
jgi:probable sporulation protein (polysaccharide deacetylase family)